MSQDHEDVWELIRKSRREALTDPDLQSIGPNRVPDGDSSFVETADEVQQAISHCVRHSMM